MNWYKAEIIDNDEYSLSPLIQAAEWKAVKVIDRIMWYQ
jgi:hypothetical protein